MQVRQMEFPAGGEQMAERLDMIKTITNNSIFYRFV